MTQIESLFFVFVGSQLQNWCWSSLLNMPRQGASMEVISAFSKNVFTTAFDTQITKHFVSVFVVPNT
jgi:hypothetical protein